MCAVERVEATSANGGASHSTVMDGYVHCWTHALTTTTDNTLSCARTPATTVPCTDDTCDDAGSLKTSSPNSVPHRDQWLALRVRGGTRTWPKFPSCFNNHA